MSDTVTLKLQIEMVPLSSWGSSLRNSIPRTRWDKLRKEVHERNGGKCQICGSVERLSCHEHWEFDEASKVQRLIGLGTICGMCHHVAHIGRSKQLAAQGHLDLAAVVNHFLSVNGCEMKTFQAHEKEALKTFTRRSNVQWQVDFGEYSEIVRAYAR
jgi:hypothetical protein